MNPLDRVLAVSQLFILACWEAIGLIAYDWNPWIVAAVWFVGLWTFNVLVASGISVYAKLMRAESAGDDTNVVNLRAVTPPDEAV